jgi:hypothetical protein
MSDYYDNSDDTFDNSLLDNYITTTLDEIQSQYVIPNGTKDIEVVDEIEVIGDTKILYTKSGKSFAEHQVENIGVVYEYVTKDSE